MKKNINLNNICIIIVAVLLSLSYVLRMAVENYDFSSTFHFNVFFIFYIILFSVPILILLYLLVKFLSKLSISKSSNLINKRYIFIISFLCIFISSLLFLLTYYPGSNMNDTLYIIHSPVFYSFQYPLIYSLIISGIYNLFYIITNSMNVSFFLLSILQIIFMSCILSYVITWCHEKFKNNYSSVVLIFLFSILPIFSNYNSALLRDPIFTAFVLLSLTFLYDICSSDASKLDDEKFFIKFILVLTLLCLSRNNGFFILIGIVGSLLLSYKRYFKKIFVLFIVVLTISNVTLFLPDNMNKEQLFQEKVAIPLQQIAFVLKEGGLSVEDLNYLSKLMPNNTMKLNYNPYNVDTIKWSPFFNREYLNDTKMQFMKIWFKNLIPNFESYLKAYFLHTYDLWSIKEFNREQTVFLGLDLRDERVTVYFDKLKHVDVFPKTLQSFLENYYEKFTVSLNGGSMFFILLIFVIICLQKRPKYYLIFIPFIFNWLSLMIACPLPHAMRYMCCFIYGLPILFLITFSNVKE